MESPALDSPAGGPLAFLVSDSLVSFTAVDSCVQLPLVPPLCDVTGFACFTAQLSPAIGTGSNALLGYFTAASPDSSVEVLSGDELFGGTAFDQSLHAYPPGDVSISVVPEPGVSVLLLLAAIGSLALRRRESSRDSLAAFK